MKRPLRILPLSLVLTVAFTVQSKAQLNLCGAPCVFGSSQISVSQSVVHMYGYTEVDYATAYGYSVEVDVFPNGDVNAGIYAQGAPTVDQAATLSAAAGTSYWVQNNHWLLTNGSDPLGFGGITPQWWPNNMTVYATGTPSGSNKIAIGYTYASTNTFGSQPAISGVDEGTYGNAQPGTTGYVILYGNNLTATWANTATATQVSIPGVTTSLAYVGTDQVNVYYSIPAGMAAGSIPSTLTTPYGTANFTFTVNTSTLQSQTITFGPLSDQTLGTNPFTVSASASSGLAVSFSSDTPGVCTVSGSTVSLVATGTCTIRARQAGNSTYAAAPDVTRSFAVTAASGGTPYKEYVRLSSRLIAIETRQATGGGLTVSASPSSGSGSSGTFTFTASNGGVSTGLTGMNILINTAIDGTHACWMYFDGSSVSLANDDGTWSGNLSNSQCGISSVTNLSNSSGFSFSVFISFSTSFAGAKYIYMTASNASTSTGYLLEGNWTVTAGGLTVSASPTSGSGWSQTFTFSASDSGSSATVAGMTVLINSDIDGNHACWMYFDHSGLSLASDDGSTWSGTTLTNSQCSLSSVHDLTNSTTLQFSALITFTSSFAGARNVYIYASNQQGASVGYSPSLGTWTVP